MINYLSLFSGIGAFEKALKNLQIPFNLIGFSEIDKAAIKSYCSIHGISNNLNLGNITEINAEMISDNIDLITHGSPCQDFSIAGLNKGGDVDSETRSSLLWNSVHIICIKRPKYVIWENVKNITSQKHKHNFIKYQEVLVENGYKNYISILDTDNFGLPHSRKRVFIVSIREDLNQEFKFPKGYLYKNKLSDYLEQNPHDSFFLKEESLNKILLEMSEETYSATDFPIVRPCLTPFREEKRQNGRRFKNNGEPCFTITSQDRHGVGIANDFDISVDGLIIPNFKVRKLTPLESWMLQGFSIQDFRKAEAICSTSSLYKQAGNSISVPILMEIFKNLLNEERILE